MRQRRSGFAIVEPFIVSLFLLAFGIAATYLLRWSLSTTHWTTWIPTVVFGIPFLIFYGLIVPMIIYRNWRERKSIY